MPIEIEVGNRLTIPIFIRRILNIQVGDTLFYRIEDGKIILTPREEKGYPIKVRKLFRITFPKHFRELYKIKERDKFYLEIIEEEIVLQRVVSKNIELTYIDC